MTLPFSVSRIQLIPHLCYCSRLPKKIILFSLSLTHITVDNEQQIATNCLSELLVDSWEPRIIFHIFMFLRVFKLNFLLALFVHHQLANVVYSWKLRNKLSLHRRRFHWILKWRFSSNDACHSLNAWEAEKNLFISIMAVYLPFDLVKIFEKILLTKCKKIYMCWSPYS